MPLDLNAIKDPMLRGWVEIYQMKHWMEEVEGWLGNTVVSIVLPSFRREHPERRTMCIAMLKGQEKHDVTLEKILEALFHQVSGAGTMACFFLPIPNPLEHRAHVVMDPWVNAWGYPRSYCHHNQTETLQKVLQERGLTVELKEEDLSLIVSW